MDRRYRRAIVIAWLVVGEGLLLAAPAQAGPILDWLFGDSTQNDNQVVAYYPNYPATAAYYPPAPSTPWQTYYGGTPAAASGSSCCQSTVTYPAAAPVTCNRPTVVYQVAEDPCAPTCAPVPVACEPPRQSCWDRITSCFRSEPRPVVPQASYRTTWKRIPVTRYRPIMTADPVTGCSVTVMKACTTYAWQPERQRCSFFDRLLGRCDPTPAVNPCCGNPCAVAATAPASGCGCGGATPVPATVPGAAPPPYYVPGPASPTLVPGAARPPASASPPNLSPQTVPPSGGAEPADTRPRLAPGYGAPDSGMNAPQSNASPDRGGSVTDRGTQDAQHSGSDVRSQTILSKPVPLPSLGDPGVRNDGARPTPVPDPDAMPTRAGEQNDAPQLLNPRDQVAVLRSNQAWAVTPISWPQVSRSEPRSKPVTKAQPRQPSRSLDESGWYSIAR